MSLKVPVGRTAPHHPLSNLLIGKLLVPQWANKLPGFWRQTSFAQMAGTQQDNPKGSVDMAPAENGHDLASNSAEDEWDEERLEKAMNTLKEMHIQLRGLRTTIPRLIAPLTTKQPSPEVLYREFSKSTSTANQEVQQFRKLMNDEESLKVLEQARKSRAENPNGIKPWKVTEHPDWATRGT